MTPMRLLLSLALAATLATAPAGAQEAGGGRSTLAGAGSSLGQEILVRWAANYRRATGPAPGDRATGSPLTYESVGSLSGTMRAKDQDRKSTRLNSSHVSESRMPSSA